jgi:hypothetical protein
MVRIVKLFGVVTLVLLGIGGCGLKDDAEDKIGGLGDPSAQGTGAAAANATAGVADFMTDLLNNLNNVPALKPSKTASAFPEPVVDCSGGGQVTVTGNSTFTATAANCVENNGTVVVNATINGTVGPTVQCTDDDGDGPFDLATSMTATINGTISIEGIVFDMTNLGMALSGITYDSSNNCSVAGFTDVITGKISTDDPVEVEFNFGTGSLTLGVIVDNFSDSVQVTMDGSMSTDTPCADKSFTLATISPLVYSSGGTCPVSGQLSLTGGLSGTVTFPDDCSDPACVFGG